MTAGLQIWRKNAIDKTIPSLDITSRCLNVLGYIDTGLWITCNDTQYPPDDQLSYNDDHIFEWRSIHVPELLLGEPFYNVSSKLLKIVFSSKGDLFRKWIWEEVSYVHNDSDLMEFLTDDQECYVSPLTPDVKIEGANFKYRYNPEWANNVFGQERLFIVNGGFRISYGVL